MNQLIPAIVFVTGRNCESYVPAALRSINRQTHEATHVLYVDDGSDDGTPALAQALLQELFAQRHTFVRNASSWGKARNAHVHLRAAIERQPGGFVVIVDADDQLIDDTLFAEMAAAYGKGYDVVWSNYRTDRQRRGGNRALDPFALPRAQGWLTSHCFSFRAELLHSVPEHYFQDEQGQWLRAACDLAIAYPALDQTRRYCFLPREAYQYTETNPASHHNADSRSVGLSSPLQQQCAAVVLNKPPLPCRRFVSEVPAVLDAALGQKFATVEARLGQLCQEAAQLSAQAARAPFMQIAVHALHQHEHVPLHWLRSTGGWAMDVELLHHLCTLLDRHEHPRVLEFGSGRGSRVLAQLCANRKGSLVSVEHDPQWHAQTTAELQHANLSHCARVQLAPLQEVSFYELPGRFYDMSWLAEGERFDLVVVDGPPAVTAPLARLPALPAVASHLNLNSFDIVLDDYERIEEQKIVEIWRMVAPDLRYETLHFAKGVCVLGC